MGGVNFEMKGMCTALCKLQKIQWMSLLFFSRQFGGKLVSFSNSRGGDVPKVVTISQVITEQDLLQRSEQLENSLTQQLFADFCDHKSQESPNERERTLWNFLKVCGCVDNSTVHAVVQLVFWVVMLISSGLQIM